MFLKACSNMSGFFSILEDQIAAAAVPILQESGGVVEGRVVAESESWVSALVRRRLLLEIS